MKTAMFMLVLLGFVGASRLQAYQSVAPKMMWSDAAVAKGCKASEKDLNVQNDIPDKVDFQKPIIGFKHTQLTPASPLCMLDDKATLGGEGLIGVREVSDDGWSCAVDNLSKSNVVVRVQSSLNSDDPTREQTTSMYYYVPAGESMLTNNGFGGPKSICELCGAAVVPKASRYPGIKELEQASYNFQCKRRCRAILFQNRNFNGASATISLNVADLSSAGLSSPAKISALKIYGGGCEVRFYENNDFNGNNGKPVCTFQVPHESGSAAFDMDALRTACCNERCPSGHDCVKSVAIRDLSKCAVPKKDGKPDTCPDCLRPPEISRKMINLVKGGSFDGVDPKTVQTNEHRHVYTTPPNFTCTKAKSCAIVESRDKIWGGVPSVDGDFFLALQRNGAEVTTTITTEPGALYEVSFSYRKRYPLDFTTEQTVQAKITADDGAVQHVKTYTASNSEWNRAQFEFTAKGTKQTLSVMNVCQDGVGPQYDLTLFIDSLKMYKLRSATRPLAAQAFKHIEELFEDDFFGI